MKEILSGLEFKKTYGYGDYVILTNLLETNVLDYKFQLGMNYDPNFFSLKFCKEQELYKLINHGDTVNIFYRPVFIPDDSVIQIKYNDIFIANKLELGYRDFIENSIMWNNSEFCNNAMEWDRYFVRYVKQ